MVIATDALAMTGDVAASVAAVAGSVAAVYAVRGFRRMGAQGKREEERHLAEIRPRPGFESAILSRPPGPGHPATLRVRAINPGGAATQWVAVLHADTFLFLYRNACPAHYTTPPSAVTKLKSVASGLPLNIVGDAGLLASYATDVEGGGWDLRTGQRTEQPLVDYMRVHLAPWGVTLDGAGNLVAVRLPSADTRTVGPAAATS